jgi:arylsulfatase A-like enzyme
MRIMFAKRIAFVIALVAIAAASCGKSRNANVLVITIDTLRADYLSCYGYPRPTSPRIDDFASGAALFEKTLCQVPETLPSHASIFTGLYPRTHKAISHESIVAPEVVTLAEVLKDHGYATGAMISSHVLDAKYGLDQGFDTYVPIHYAASERERNEMIQHEQDLTTETALKWIDAHKRSKFFLWIHWFHPHRPYDPPPRYKLAFAGEYAGPAAADQNDFAMRVWRDRIAVAPEDISYMRGLYAGEVAFTDEQVGRVLDELSKLGLLDNTIVVITSDHGEILYEHEYYFGHDIAVYDECTMVPLIVRIPGIGTPGKRVPGLVQSIDIFPTVLEALSIKPPRPVEGKSLVPLIEGKAGSTTEYGFTETFPFPEKCPPRHAVRTENAKVMWCEEPSGEITKMYYDLAADPGETANLYPTPAATALDDTLSAWIEPGGLHPAPIPSARDSGRWRILKSLGYVD